MSANLKTQTSHYNAGHECTRKVTLLKLVCLPCFTKHLNLYFLIFFLDCFCVSHMAILWWQQVSVENLLKDLEVKIFSLQVTAAVYFFFPSILFLKTPTFLFGFSWRILEMSVIPYACQCQPANSFVYLFFFFIRFLNVSGFLFFFKFCLSPLFLLISQQHTFPNFGLKKPVFFFFNVLLL